MAVTRIKVGREQLIVKLEERRAAIVATREREVEEYPAAVREFAGELAHQLQELAELFASGDPDAVTGDERVRAYGDETRVTLDVSVPSRPSTVDGADVRRIDRLLGPLRMSDDETVSVATDDEYARYL